MNEPKTRFVTLFPRAENIHLIKDVGMVPYALHRYAGYDSSLVCYRNGEYPYSEKEVKGLALSFLERRGGEFLDAARYLFRHGREIDVLNLYHFTLRTFLFVLIYQCVNRKGLVYIKTDMDLGAFFGKLFGIKCRLFRLLFRFVFRPCVISAESVAVMDLLEKKIRQEIALVPNGVVARPLCKTEKKDVILTVGRLGCEQKATDVLLRAFAACADSIPSWNLHLAGPVTPAFSSFIDDYFLAYPRLKERVLFLGNITDRSRIFECYSEAKVFALPSRWESFGIALIEALSAGCYIITSERVPPAKEIICDGAFGKIVPPDDVAALSAAITSICRSIPFSHRLYGDIADYAKERFGWETIAAGLDRVLRRSGNA